MIVLSGASASGKTEVAKVLSKKYGITKITTTTTRNMRVGEVNGRDYFFVSKEKFLEMLKQNLFVEHTLYNGNYYGSTKDQIKSNRCVVIDPIGLKSYVQLNDETIITYFLESSEEIRFKRMLERGDKKEDAKARIVNDRTAFSKESMPKVDYIISSEKETVDEVAQTVYELYINHIKNKL